MHCVTKKSMDDEGLRFQIINLLKSAGASSSDRDLNNAVMNIWSPKNRLSPHISVNEIQVEISNTEMTNERS